MKVKSDEDRRVYDFTSSITFCGRKETGEQVFCQGHGSTYQGKLSNDTDKDSR